MKWLADENFDNDILRGIWRRVAGFEVVRAQDVAEISGWMIRLCLRGQLGNHE